MSQKSKDPREEDDSELPEEEEEWQELAEDPEAVRRIFRAIEGLGILKRATIKGVGDALMSEDGLRAMLSDQQKRLPKEAAGLLFSQADTMRKETLRIVSGEIRTFLENMDFGGEIAKILTSVSFEIKTEIRFIPNDQSVRAQVKNKVETRSQGAGGEEPSEESSSDEEKGAAEESKPILSRKLRWGRRKKKDEEDEGEEEVE